MSTHIFPKMLISCFLCWTGALPVDKLAAKTVTFYKELNLMAFKQFLAGTCALLTAGAALADEPDVQNDWRANFRRVALDISSTSVGNAEEYQDSPNSKLSADGEQVIKGVLDFVLEHETSSVRWDNALYAEYGKTTLKPAEGEKTKTENADKILISTDYTEKLWKWDEADVGPFANLGYQTEFTKSDDAPLTKVFRGKAGFKALNGTYFDDMYIALVQDWDLTYDEDIQKTAGEFGGHWAYNLRDGVDFKLEGYYRRYFAYSQYEATDFEYELNLTGRMDVALKNCFSMSPFVQYFRAKARGADKDGDNLLIGISIGYTNIFDF